MHEAAAWVEEFWPEVEWARDETFASMYPPDWACTHIRVTRLPRHLEERGCEPNASADALAFAVAAALQAHTEPKRVAHWSGQGDDIRVNFYGITSNLKNAAREMGVEYSAPGWLHAGTA
jgi:hypothetical protein